MLTTTSGRPILRPDEISALFVGPTMALSAAAQVATIVHTSSHAFRIPRVLTDPSANWVAEGDEITPSDATLDEVVVEPAKVAGLSIISNELRDDSSPAAAEAIGAGLARDTARRIDQAFFGSVAAPAPSGLGALSGVQAVTGALDNLDPFAEAISKAEQVGATVTAFVANPADALTLAQVKTGDTSNAPLLGVDPTSATKRQVQGVPLYVSPYVAAGTIWSLDGSRTYLVVRTDVSIEADSSPFFTSDRTAIRSVMRAAFGFPHAASVVKVTVS